MLGSIRWLPTLLFAVTSVVTALSNSPLHAAGMYQLTDLGVAPAGYVVPIINSSGQVIQDPEGGGSLMSAGSYSIDSAPSQLPGNNTQTYLLQNGSVIATLNTFVGSPSDNQIYGHAVNKSGMVVGIETNGELTPAGVAFYYTPAGGMHAIPQLYPSSNAMTAATSVNDAGMIVGFSTGPGGFNDPIRLAYLSNGQTSWDLNTLIAPGSGLTLTSATYISDNGQIAGFGVDAKGQEHIVLLTPMATPEPSTLLILAVGCLAVGVCKQRARHHPVLHGCRPAAARHRCSADR